MRWACIGFALLPLLTFGQAAPQRMTKADAIDALARSARGAAAVPGTVDPFASAVHGSSGQIIANWLIGSGRSENQAYEEFASMLEKSLERQVGAGSTGNGTTSLTMKGAAPRILGLAVEHGALTRDVNGEVVTFRGTPAGLLSAFRSEGVLDVYAKQNGWDRLSYAASFDISRGKTPQTLLADDKQLSSWSLRFEILNGRDARLKRYARQWRNLASSATGDPISAIGKLREALDLWLDFKTWQAKLVAEVKAKVDALLPPTRSTADLDKAESTFRGILEKELDTLPAISTAGAPVTNAAEAYVKAMKAYLETRADLIDFAQKGPLLTFDWTTERDSALPDLYTLTGIFEASPDKKRKTDLTLNSAFSFYRVDLKDSGRKLRDYKLSGQYDIPIGNFMKVPFVLSFAGRYEYIPNDTRTPGDKAIAELTGVSPSGSGGMGAAAASTMVTPKGHLRVFQSKLTIPLKGTGAKIPLSVTFANRTELIKEKEVRVNFGFTFDLDAFASVVSSRLGKP